VAEVVWGGLEEAWVAAGRVAATAAAAAVMAADSAAAGSAARAASRGGGAEERAGMGETAGLVARVAAMGSAAVRRNRRGVCTSQPHAKLAPEAREVVGQGEALVEVRARQAAVAGPEAARAAGTARPCGIFDRSSRRWRKSKGRPPRHPRFSNEELQRSQILSEKGVGESKRQGLCGQGIGTHQTVLSHDSASRTSRATGKPHDPRCPGANPNRNRR